MSSRGSSANSSSGSNQSPSAAQQSPAAATSLPISVTQNSASTTLTVQIGDASMTISGASSTTPPTITINGDNPAIITLGSSSYADLGATVSDTEPTARCYPTSCSIRARSRPTPSTSQPTPTASPPLRRAPLSSKQPQRRPQQLNRSTFARHSSTTSVLLSF